MTRHRALSISFAITVAFVALALFVGANTGQLGFVASTEGPELAAVSSDASAEEGSTLQGSSISHLVASDDDDQHDGESEQGEDD